MVKAVLKNLLLTYVLNVVISFIALLIYYKPSLSTREGGQMVIISIVACFYISLLLALSSLTALFVIVTDYQRRRLLSILAFFLLPCIITYCWGLSPQGETPFAIIGLCFLAIHAFFFYKIRRRTQLLSES